MTDKDYYEATCIQNRIKEYERRIRNIDCLYDRMKQKLEDDPCSYISIQLDESWMYTPSAEVNTDDLFFFLNDQKERLKLLINVEKQNFENL